MNWHPIFHPLVEADVKAWLVRAALIAHHPVDETLAPEPDAAFSRPSDSFRNITMFNNPRNGRTRRTVARHPIAEGLWREALQRCSPTRRLGASDQGILRVLATLFLDRKSREPVQGLVLDDTDRVLRAAHACVPILKLGLDYYDGWHGVIVYPAAFIPRREQIDAAGVVHQTNSILAGEAWGRGPVILSGADVLDIG